MSARDIPDAHRDDVTAIARSHGVADPEISLAPRQGQVNLTVFLGDDLVLRLPRKQEFETRLAKEAAVIPYVLGHGLPTAGLVRFDPGHTIADVAYIVLERLHGHTIDDVAPTAAESQRTLRSLCRILAGLHQLRGSARSPIPGVQAAQFSSRDLVDELVDGGEIGRSQAVWVDGWFRQLEGHGARHTGPVLLHGDVMPSNLVLDASGETTALIDWGSACWGEAARDLAGFRTTHLPAVIDAYRRATDHPDGDASDISVEAGVLWYQLFFALAKLLGRSSTSEVRNWSAPRGARFLELMRFVSTGVPDGWSTLLPRP